jgi:decaprenylphospho-beta-D-erythro-pentofuranosid-2-ulose 2-reductase
MTERKNVIVLGATSAIAEATVRIWAERGYRVLLCGRSASHLDTIAQDLRARGAVAETAALDLAVCDAEKEFPGLVDRLGGADIVLVAYGMLGDQTRAESDRQEAETIFRTDFSSAAHWCLAAANYLEARKSGVLVVIGSVAGDRGRASNYIYGSAKAGLGVLVQGLAHRLARTGARAVLVKPGFVATPMTHSMGGRGLLWSKPDTIARIIAMAAERPRPIVYAPSFWRPIMRIVRELPYRVMHRTRL